MRKRLWQLHSWLGLLAGLGLLVIGLTGSLLMFREEIEAVVHPGLVRVEPTAAGRLSADALLAHAERQLAGNGYEVTGWLYQYEKPHLADILYAIKHGTNEWRVATINPHSGQLLATPRAPNATLHGWLLDLHYTFFADHAGMLITGAFAVALCLLGVTGVWLYREFWRHLFTLRWGRSARIFFSDLHKMIGISSAAFNLLLGFTGAYWNFSHVLGEWVAGEHEQAKLPGRLYADTLSLDALCADAAQRLPGFRANYVSFPWEPGGGFTLWGAVEPRGVLRGPYGSTVAYDAQKGTFQSLHDLRTAGWWQQGVDAFTPLHFGTFGGLPVKLLWCLGGLAPGALAISGFVIWRQRREKIPTPARSREEVAAGR
ncbi:MAG TPA: PepSY-associated TM helix domain-containing protein [Opitutaceae bacterium]